MRPAIPLTSRLWRVPALTVEAAGRQWVQTGLLVVSFAALLVSWTLMWKILLETPIIDVTGIEPTLLIGAVLLPFARPWRLVQRFDRPIVELHAALFAWFLVTALTRGSGEDVKRALS